VYFGGGGYAESRLGQLEHFKHF